MPINFRLNVDEVSYIVEHSGASVLLVDPELDESLSAVEREVSVCHRCRGRRRAARVRSGARALDSRRRRDRDHQLHERHDGAAQGRAAHAPQHLGQRDDVRLAHRRDRSRRLPAHAADVPLQRLGDALCGHRHGRPEHRAAQGRRRRDPASCREARGDVAVRSACRRCDDPRRGGEVGRPDPGRGAHAHGRRRRAAAHPHDRAHRDRARVGVHPDLRAHRDVPVPRDEPLTRRVRRPDAERARRAPEPRRVRPRSASRWPSTPKAKCSRAATWCSRGTGISPRRPRRRSSTGGSAPAMAAASTTRATSRSRTARRT